MVEKQVQENEEISMKELILKLQEWWNYLLSKWAIICITSVIGAILGLAYAYSQKPEYTAELTFVVEGGRSGSSGGYSSLASQFGINLGGSGSDGVFEGENLLILMKSRLMIEKALLTTVNIKGEKKTLAEYYIDMKNLREKWAKKNPMLAKIRFLPGADPSKFSLEQNSLISSFHSALKGNNLSVDNKDKKSSILSMRVTSEDELFSKYFTEALAKEVSEFYVETKTKKQAANLAILQHQADSVKRAFNSAISEVATSTDANPNANPLRQRLRVPSQLRQVDVQINQAMLEQLVQNVEIAKMSLRTETPFILPIDNPILPLPKSVHNRFNALILGGIMGGGIAVFIMVIKKILKDLIVKYRT